MTSVFALAQDDRVEEDFRDIKLLLFAGPAGRKLWA